MRNTGLAASGRPQASDIGTLWTLERDDCTARCGVVAVADAWEVRVSMNGDLLLSQRCELRHEVFGMAERWRMRMAERGWKKVTVAVRPRPDRRRAR
jgi:hypothetical protein